MKNKSEQEILRSIHQVICEYIANADKNNGVKRTLKQNGECLLLTNEGSFNDLVNKVLSPSSSEFTEATNIIQYFFDDFERQRYIKKYGFGGYMITNKGYEYFTGKSID